MVVPKPTRRGRLLGGARALVAGIVIAAAAGVACANDDAVRSQVARPLQSVQEALKEKRFAEALAKLAELDAMADLNGSEKFLIERMRIVAASGSQDHKQATKSLAAVLEAKKLPPAEQLQMNEALVATCFVIKDYACVEQWAKRYGDAGGASAEVGLRRAQAAYLLGHYAAGAELAGKLVADDVKAGRRPMQDSLQLQASCFAKLKDDAGYREVLERTVTYYPSAEAWSGLIYGLMQRPGFPKRLELDGYRLLLANGALTGGDEYLDMAEAAIKAGFPLEAAQVLDKAERAGVFATASEKTHHQEMRSRLAKLIADDRKAIEQTDAMLAKAKDGNLNVGLGMNLVVAGQALRGLQVIEQGIARGVGANADEARLHLGYARWLAGDKNAALESFGAGFAPGPVADFARWWRVHLSQ